MAFGTRALTGTMLEGRYLVGDPSRETETWTEFRALDTRTNAEVDVRVVREGLGPESRAASALALEAVVASEVRHPSVLAPRDVGMLEDTTPFLVTARHDAETLEDRVCLAGSLSAGDVVRLGLELCSVLAAAHDRGIVHGDLRPEHVLLVEREGVLLSTLVAGWGVVRSVRAAPIAYPSLAFVAPELAEGASPSAMTDIYAIGAILYFAATGFPPYTAPSATALSAMVKEGALRSPSALRPELPSRLVRAIVQALQPEPGVRFYDAREMLNALETARAGFGPAYAKARPVRDAFNREVTQVERVERATTPAPSPSSLAHDELLFALDEALAHASALAGAGEGAVNDAYEDLARPSVMPPHRERWTKSDVVPSLRAAATTMPGGFDARSATR